MANPTNIIFLDGSDVNDNYSDRTTTEWISQIFSGRNPTLEAIQSPHITLRRIGLSLEPILLAILMANKMYIRNVKIEILDFVDKCTGPRK
jgi:hypothetical protein